VQPPELAVTAALESGHGQVVIAGRQPVQDFRAAGLEQAADREARVRPVASLATSGSRVISASSAARHGQLAK
jgi:hypothetical protein